MAKHYKVTNDNDNRGGMFIVHVHSKNIEFVCHARGLHYLDLSNKEIPKVMLAMILQEQFEVFTKLRLR